MKELSSITGRRLWAERAGQFAAAGCGIGVISALALMFGYLLYEVWPLASSTASEPRAFWSAPGQTADADSFALINHRGGKVLSLSSRGPEVYRMDSMGDGGDGGAGNAEQPPQLELLEKWMRQGKITVVSAAPDAEMALVIGPQGQAVPVKAGFDLQWAQGESDFHNAQVNARLDLPLGDRVLETGLTEDLSGQTGQGIGPELGPGIGPELGPGTKLALAYSDRALLLAVAQGRNLHLLRWPLRESAFGGRLVPGRRQQAQVELADVPQQLLAGAKGDIYALSADGTAAVYRFTGRRAELQARRRLTEAASALGHAALLLGDKSLIVGDSAGRLAAWRLMTTAEQTSPQLVHIRDYQPLPDQAVARIVPEKGRKGFAVFGGHNALNLYYLGEPDAAVQSVSDSLNVPTGAWFDTSSRLLAATDGRRWQAWRLHNEYPETSVGLLWGKAWYEGHESAKYLWQSSSADLDFEPKFSLVPLLLGTLKGALYAMLFAAPIALMTAIYVARFMAPLARNYAKPAIEIMAAVPTVILGFIGALWLAPIASDNLVGLLLMAPLILLTFAGIPLLLRLLPDLPLLRYLDGWEFVAALPLTVLVGWLCLSASPLLEIWLFAGDTQAWLDQSLGVIYEERNAFIVGVIMGFAVIPTIFSIAEDALFQAPKSLMDGGLALGATPWQCVSRIIVPTASPAIFSALMVGFGRAVGETMVVVMCTGNTAITDWDIFSGMRTLSANIAVEMPEAELGSSHFRLLFLSALVLFALTFVFNTLAELVRNWLRRRYASL